MSEILIYQIEKSQIEIDVKFEDETVWLTQKQMALLFEQTKQNISLHINNCYKEGELNRKATVKESLTVQKEGKRTIKRNVDYYNLDVIISVGYRVKSQRGTQFRQWATQKLKKYLFQGYVINKKRLAEKEFEVKQLKSGISIIRRTIEQQARTLHEVKGLAALLDDYSHGLSLLDDFDHKQLDRYGRTKKDAVKIEYEQYIKLIDAMRTEFSSPIFGKEKDKSFQSSISQIYQVFEKQELYPSLEEKAAMLIYLVVKNHSFIDGNKRIAAACFLYFLEQNGMLYTSSGEKLLSNDALASLTLLIAESVPNEMETVKQVVVSILNRKNINE